MEEQFHSFARKTKLHVLSYGCVTVTFGSWTDCLILSTKHRNGMIKQNFSESLKKYAHGFTYSTEEPQLGVESSASRG